jgi:hypothetical protein
MSNDLNDLAYPLWIETVSPGPPAPGGAPGSPASAPTNALGDVLGWRFNVRDPEGFKSALASAFPLVAAREGHLVPQYAPRSYSVQSVQSGVSALTGANKSIFDRTKVIVDQIDALLADIEPLAGGTDPNDIEPIRELIPGALQELLDQFGRQGGPVVQRVDNAFELLTGGETFDASVTAETIKGYLGLLRSCLQLSSANVNNIDEEETYTRFVTVVDWTLMLMREWDDLRPTFISTTTNTFFGTQLFVVQSELACVASSIQELYQALDSVFFREDERATTALEDRTDTSAPTITVGEILRWGEDIASNKSVGMLASKDGAMKGFLPTVSRYRDVLNSYLVPATGTAKGSRRDVSPLHTARVRACVQQFVRHVEAVVDAVSAIHRGPIASPAVNLG